MPAAYPLDCNPWCPACRAPMPRDAFGACVDCAALRSISRREPREREPEPPPPTERGMMIEDLKARFDDRYERAVALLTPAQRRVFDLVHRTRDTSAGQAARLLGISRSAVSQMMAAIDDVFIRAKLPPPLHPRDRPDRRKGNAA